MQFRIRHSGEGRNPVPAEAFKSTFKRYALSMPAFAGMTAIDSKSS
jgi:hypothetical protein